MSLVCTDLHFAYSPERPVLAGIGFRVETGTFCVLLGRNGSGKTTLLYCLAGLMKPDQGQVMLHDLDVSRAPRAEVARRMSLVPQEHSDIFPFSVLDVVVMGRTAHLGFAQRPGPEDYAAARRTLEELQAGHLAERNFNRISGGERRITLLARALVQSRDVLLMDEPTNHLDFHNTHAMLQRIRALCRDSGTSVVASLHDPNLARLFADHVVLINQGRIEAQGRPEDIMTETTVSALYETPVRVLHTSGGPPVFLPRDSCEHES